MAKRLTAADITLRPLPAGRGYGWATPDMRFVFIPAPRDGWLMRTRGTQRPIRDLRQGKAAAALILNREAASA